MESDQHRLTATEAAAALADAEASRTAFADRIETPSWFFFSMGVAVTAQIATTAVTLARGDLWVLAAGLAIFVTVAGVQLTRFRRLNGVWLGGLASRVVLGTGMRASLAEGVALAAATWAAFDARWSLVVLCSVLGGGAYALSGRRWLRIYRAEPATLARGESIALLALVMVAVVAGAVLLLIGA